MERKFTRVLPRPGMAAQLREDVSQAVKETTIQVRRLKQDKLIDIEVRQVTGGHPKSGQHFEVTFRRY